MQSSQCIGELEIGWRWDTPDRWMFHRTDKDAIWSMLNTGKLDFKFLYQVLQVKESWLEVKPGCKAAANYPLVKFIRDNYMKHYRKFKPGLALRLVMNKLGIFLVVLFKEDSAYVERIGGALQYILDNSDEWSTLTTKEDRLLFLTDLYQWWYENDWRKRTKGIIDVIFKWFLENYEKDQFIEASTNYIINLLILNKKNWVPVPIKYDPENWYPRGCGQVNYLVHGRKS